MFLHWLQQSNYNRKYIAFSMKIIYELALFLGLAEPVENVMYQSTQQGQNNMQSSPASTLLPGDDSISGTLKMLKRISFIENSKYCIHNAILRHNNCYDISKLNFC